MRHRLLSCALSLEERDQFAVTAFRAFSVKTVGVASSSVGVESQSPLDARDSGDPLGVTHLPQTL